VSSGEDDVISFGAEPLVPLVYLPACSLLEIVSRDDIMLAMISQGCLFSCVLLSSEEVLDDLEQRHLMLMLKERGRLSRPWWTLNSRSISTGLGLASLYGHDRRGILMVHLNHSTNNR
jgi:hypothetical protein